MKKMKNFKGSLAAKLMAWFLITVSAVALLAGVVGAYAIQESGIYTESIEEVRAQKFDTISRRYSAFALQNIGNGYNEQYFADKNFQYGIIKAADYEALKQLDLNKDSTYEERNFKQQVKLDDLSLFQCNLNNRTYIYVDTSLFGSYYISGSTIDYMCKQIKSYVYDLEGGLFYYETMDGVFYPVCQLEVVVGSDDAQETYDFAYDAFNKAYQNMTDQPGLESDKCTLQLTINLGTEISEIELEQITEIFKQPYMRMNELDGTPFYFTAWSAKLHYPQEADALQEETAEADMTVEENVDFQGTVSTTVTSPTSEESELVEWEKVELTEKNLSDDERKLITDKLNYDVYQGGSLYVPKGDDEGTDYYVVSFVPDELVRKEGVSIWGNDLYVQTDYLLGIAEQIKYSIYVWIAVSLLLMVGSLVFLCCAAGYEKGEEKVTATILGKIPFDLLMVGWIFLEVVLYIVMIEVSYAIRVQEMAVFYLAGEVFLLICAGWCALGILLEFVVRVKLGSWWKGTLIYKLCRAVYHSFRKIGENRSILWKWIVLFFAVNLAEVFIFFIVDSVRMSMIAMVWFAEKVLIFIGGMILLTQLARLLNGSRHIAEGDIHYKVDTEKMLPSLKEHGENLNQINEAVSKAVDEKLRSERFKTELITNVSHDIKTPLTSIINYVDLLEKEEIENENVKEYLAVLERQSARLKKLIEDLIEASKASSGSLPVNLEKLEAGVFLVQTVGEFDEKMQKNHLNLQIVKPEEPIYIMADGRHFWRVIDNLMNNICKYAQPQTRVYINLEEKDDQVSIIFRNTSKFPLNISSEELLERFVRGDSSRNTEGNGLGLSIAGSLMELMHGKMKLYVDGDLFKVVLEFAAVKDAAMKGNLTE